MTTERLTHPIYVFASMQHAHLTVTHIKSEMLRDGAGRSRRSATRP